METGEGGRRRDNENWRMTEKEAEGRNQAGDSKRRMQTGERGIKEKNAGSATIFKITKLYYQSL
jgi:hypothetical protein